ncbi:transmembrane protein 260-like isoform X2 [Physella acuta]|nr:transmembrane protein 260-like isoform X2 [Physella acuta]
MPEMISNKNGSLSIVVFTCVLSFYYKNLHHSLPGGDSGELIVAAYEFGVAHPPGYPLFTLLAKLLISIIPVGSIAWRVNLLSALCGALSAVVLYLIVYRMTLLHGAGLFAACIFSCSSLVCTWSVTAEVFTLNTLLLSSLMLTAIKFESSPKQTAPKVSLIGSFLCGLCLSNQHTSVLYVLPLIPWAWYKLGQIQMLSFGLLLKQGLLLLCGLLPYLYLPVSSFLHIARWTWGDSRTVQGFLRHFFRTEYGTWDLLKDHTGQGFTAGLIAYINHLLSDVSLWVFLLAVCSLVSVYSRYKKQSTPMLFALMLLIYVMFFCWRANLDISNPLFYKVVERFWIQSDLLVVILASLALADIWSYLSSKLNYLPSNLDVAVVLPLIASHVYFGWPVCDQSGNVVVRDFALQTLQQFPEDSIVLTKGDLPSNSFRYFHICENVRPDLTIFDQEVLTYEWSLPMTREFYPRLHFPGDRMQLYSGVGRDGKRAFTFKDLIDANYDRHQIFACIGVQEHDPSWRADYVLWPYGVCWQIVRSNTDLDLELWTKKTANIAEDWLYPWTRFDDGSWETVASSEMWRAK